MRQWTKEMGAQQEIVVLLLPNFSNHCLANAIEPFRAANELLAKPRYIWSFVTLDGNYVTSSSGLPVLPNGTLRGHPGAEGLIVISSHNGRQMATPETKRALVAADRRFGYLAGMDTGSWLLAHAGLLNGEKATIHPSELMAFAEEFDAVDVVDDRYTIEPRRMTCGGAMSSFDLVLDILRRTHGEALKLELSSYFLEQPSRPQPGPYQSHSYSLAISACLAQMRQNMEAPLTMAALAARTKISQRSLTRYFERELGASPATVYRRIRLSAAKQYARQSRHTIAEIAVRCGYQDASAMTRAFVQEFGQTPSSLRQNEGAV